MKKSLETKNLAILLLSCIAIILALLFASFYHGWLTTRLGFSVSEPVLPQALMPEGMALKTFEVPEGDPVPTVTFTMEQGAMGDWTIHVHTTDFTFAPEKLGGTPVSGEGHVHLYIDDNMIVMLGPWYHIAKLRPGEHTIRVGLYNNDHSAYSIDGNLIQVSKTMTVSPLSEEPHAM